MDLLKWILVGAVALLSVFLVWLLLPGDTGESPQITTTPHVETPKEPSTILADDEVALTVEGQQISMQDFELAYEALVENYTRFYAQFGQDFAERLEGPEGAYFQLEMRSQIADQFIRAELLEQAFEQRGINAPSDEVEIMFQQQLDSILAQNNLDEAQADAVLQQQGSSLAQFKDELRRQIVDQLKQEKLQAEVTGEIIATNEALIQYAETNQTEFIDTLIEVEPPTEAALQAYFDDHVEEFSQVRARHILIRAETEAEIEQAFAKIEAVKQQLDEGADFAELAKEVSEDTGSGINGGDLGFFSKGQMVQPFEEAAFALDVGQISDPVQTQFGVHLILVEDKRPQPLEEVKDQITEILIQELKAEAFSTLIETAKNGDETALLKFQGEIKDTYVQKMREERFEAWFEAVEANAQIELELPLVVAFRLETVDLDKAIEAYERIKIDTRNSDPNLDYFLCELYPKRFAESTQRIEDLRAKTTLAAEEAEELTHLLNRIDLYKAQAEQC